MAHANLMSNVSSSWAACFRNLRTTLAEMKLHYYLKVTWPWLSAYQIFLMWDSSLKVACCPNLVSNGFANMELRFSKMMTSPVPLKLVPSVKVSLELVTWSFQKNDYVNSASQTTLERYSVSKATFTKLDVYSFCWHGITAFLHDLSIMTS